MKTSSSRMSLLAIHEDLPSDFFELLEEHTQGLDEESVLPHRQLTLPLTPQAEQAASSVWADVSKSDSEGALSLSFSHDLFAFCRDDSPTTRTPTQGGGPVKGYLKSGQKLLFSQIWMRRQLPQR